MIVFLLLVFSGVFHVPEWLFSFFVAPFSSAWEAQYALAAALLTGQGMDKARGIEQNNCNFDGQINGYEDDIRPLGGGFNYFSFSSRKLGKMIQF